MSGYFRSGWARRAIGKWILGITAMAAFIVMGDVNEARAALMTYTQGLTIGSLGSGNGQFTNPYYMALDSAGNIYVSDLRTNSPSARRAPRVDTIAGT